MNEEIESLKAIITERNITIKQQQEHNDALQLEQRKVTGQKMKWRAAALDMYCWMKEQMSPSYWEDFKASNGGIVELMEETLEREGKVKVQAEEGLERIP